MKRALITGITGQDGSYLAELLLSKGYEVHGLIRRSSTPNTERIASIVDHPRLNLVFGDMADASSLSRVVERTQPHEVYNLAAQSQVHVSFDVPEYTADIAALGPLRLLDVIKHASPHSRFFQASTSEMFGTLTESPQTESTPFFPRTPYGAAKVSAHWFTVNHREAHGLFACSGIMFNHESPRRGDSVTRKITRAATRIKLGLQDTLPLGNLGAVRDWGFAGDYVDAMWRMLQHDTPGDYVIATGVSRTVRDFLDCAFGLLGIDWRRHVELDERFIRPAEATALRGDSSKARRVLGWEPRVSFEQMVSMMIDHDMGLAEQELACAQKTRSSSLAIAV